MTDEPTDYTTMSGAEFRREVGVDPEKWAEAFMQTMATFEECEEPTPPEYVASWFRDAMNAARRDRAGDDAALKASTSIAHGS